LRLLILTVYQHRCIENLAAVLDAAGASINDVAKVNVYLTDLKDFDGMNEVYSKYWGVNKPARTYVSNPVSLLYG
jgi:2-iminobutanoate/2-iminopropanoate deaminase